MEEGTLQEVLSVGNRPWPSVKSFLLPLKSTLDARIFLKRSISKVCEWGGGDCGPLLVGNDEGTLSVVTLLRQ